MLFHTLTIVGVGLIGGSIGLAVKKRRLAERVLGVGRAADKLETARRLGAIDDGVTNLSEGTRDADLVVFCAPVDRIAAQVREAAATCKSGAILTDAGSTKRAIVQDVEVGLPKGVRFVGGHPLAGSHKKGVEHAHADLFVERWTVLTPTPNTSATALDAVAGFWRALGARVRTMKPDEHDQALALTSHLPHLIAAALAGILPDDLRDLTATGFRDTTRIAAGAPEVWGPIFQQNRTALLDALDLLETRLRLFHAALTKNDVAPIDQLLAQSKKVRDALGS